MCTCYQDEKFDQSKGPSITELVEKEDIDILQNMGWEIDQSKDIVKVVSSIWSTVSTACMYFLVEIFFTEFYGELNL